MQKLTFSIKVVETDYVGPIWMNVVGMCHLLADFNSELHYVSDLNLNPARDELIASYSHHPTGLLRHHSQASLRHRVLRPCHDLVDTVLLHALLRVSITRAGFFVGLGTFRWFHGSGLVGNRREHRGVNGRVGPALEDRHQGWI